MSEGLDVFDITLKVLEDINISEDLKHYLKEECSRKDSELITNGIKFFVLSFSTDRDNLNLWNYYSKNKNLQGYNIGFVRSELLNAYQVTDQDKNVVQPIHGRVIYDDKEKCEMIKDIIEILYFERNGCSTEEIGYFILQKIVYIGCLFKDVHFKDEHEYRIVLPWNPNWSTLNTNIPDIKYRELNDLRIPYLPIQIEVGKCVKNITVSPTMDFEKAKTSQKKHLKPYPRIEIKKSAIPVRY